MDHYEKLKEKGENVYIDELKYEEFMLLGETELNYRFTSLEEKEQKEKLNQEQAQELEYSQEAEVKQKPESAPIREKPEWEDTLTSYASLELHRRTEGRATDGCYCKDSKGSDYEVLLS